MSNEESNAKLIAIKYVRRECGVLLLEAKQAVEGYLSDHGGSYTEAAIGVVKAHRALLDIDAETKRIRETRAIEALRVTAGFTTEELRAMPDQALGLTYQVANAVAALINGRGSIANVRVTGDLWIAALRREAGL